MTTIAQIMPTEQADRLAIRELVDAYAHCADRRLAEEQKSLFTDDTHFVVYMNGQGSEPTQVLDGREALTPVFEDLNRYEATQHFNGQSTISLDGDRATGESYCIAHHLFTEDTHFVVYMDGQGSEPTQVLDGRDAMTPVFDDLNRYQATMHFNGQSTITLDGDQATGESYCIAHHLFTEAGERKLMVAWLRYGDTFAKLDGAWLFAQRNLYVDWTETRPSQP